MTSIVFRAGRDRAFCGSPEVARRVVEAVLERAPPPVLDEHRDGWSARTDGGDFDVELVDTAVGAVASVAGAEIWSVVDRRTWSVENVGVLPDGAVHRLRDPEALRRVYPHLRHEIPPLRIAELCIGCSSDSRGQRVVRRPSDLASFGLPEGRFGEVSGLTIPVFEARADGFCLVVCCVALRPPRVELSRWEIEDQAGQIMWRRRAIDCELTYTDDDFE